MRNRGGTRHVRGLPVGVYVVPDCRSDVSWLPSNGTYSPHYDLMLPPWNRRRDDIIFPWHSRPRYMYGMSSQDPPLPNPILPTSASGGVLRGPWSADVTRRRTAIATSGQMSIEPCCSLVLTSPVAVITSLRHIVDQVSRTGDRTRTAVCRILAVSPIKHGRHCIRWGINTGNGNKC